MGWDVSEMARSTIRMIGVAHDDRIKRCKPIAAGSRLLLRCSIYPGSLWLAG